MSNKDIVFQVDVRDLILDAEGLSALTQFLRDKQFLYRDYRGKGSGYAGTEYEYSLVKCDEKARMEIKPVNEALWLYLNTFGKETK